MNLKSIGEGRWVNQDWKEGTPGAFGVIIGVSAYPHLVGGDAPAPHTYNLGQLQVSALTAYAFFRWLAESYYFDGCPVAKVWFLVSPTETEITKQPGLRGQMAATMQDCKIAISECRNEMQKLSADTGGRSRYFLFFSGHGLEPFEGNRILLPSDFLVPPSNSVNWSLPVRNLWRGLANVPVSNRHFFLDACRSSTEDLLKIKVDGTPVLDEVASSVGFRNRSNAIVSAAPAGGLAFQPDDADQGITIFGQALIEGLLALPDFNPQPPCDIKAPPLQEFLNRRMLQLLRAHREFEYDEEDAPVVLEGIYRPKVLTRVEGSSDPANSAGRPPSFLTDLVGPPRTNSQEQISSPSKRDYEEFFIIPNFVAGAPIEQETMAENLPDREEALTRYLQKPKRRTSLGDDEADRLINAFMLYDLRQRREVMPYRIHYNDVRRASGNDSRRRYRLTFEIEFNSKPHWLHFDGASGRWATVLPPDLTDSAPSPYPTVYEVIVDVMPGGPDGPLEIKRLEANLSLANVGLLGAAARLWKKYVTANAPAAATSLLSHDDHSLATDVLEGKMESPLAATVAAILLVKAESYLFDDVDRMGGKYGLENVHKYLEWIGNLARRFPDLPDGQVLWREVLSHREIRSSDSGLMPLEERSLPFTGAALAMLMSQIKDHDSQSTADALLKRRLDVVSNLVRPAGLFTTFFGTTDQIRPEIFLGPRQAHRA